MDWFTYWVVEITRSYDKYFYEDKGKPESISVYISGNSTLERFLKTIIDNVKPTKYDVETCAFAGSPPDLKKMAFLSSLLVVVWCMGLLEPYGLRLRQIVMATYHPNISQRRAVWLYNHILTKRKTFVTDARRFLRRKFSLSIRPYKRQPHRFIKFFFSRLPLLGNIIIKRFIDNEACFICGDFACYDNHMVHCPNENCGGTFCSSCFENLGFICTICKHPAEYGDLSDVSEEVDSSEDEMKNVQKAYTSFQHRTGKSYLSETDERSGDSSPDSSLEVVLRCETEPNYMWICVTHGATAKHDFFQRFYSSTESTISTNSTQYNWCNCGHGVCSLHKKVIQLTPENSGNVLFWKCSKANVHSSDSCKFTSNFKKFSVQDTLNLKHQDHSTNIGEITFTDSEENQMVSDAVHEFSTITSSSESHEYGSLDLSFNSSRSSLERQLSSSLSSHDRINEYRRSFISFPDISLLEEVNKNVSSIDSESTINSSLYSENVLSFDSENQRVEIENKKSSDSCHLRNVSKEMISFTKKLAIPVIPKRSADFDTVINEYKQKYGKLQN
ncbi:uncharacterized protein LOC142322890 [Lycorma delicatula]|uniref:uncharacterized protein LOC142322890 n=1 Tax=Lycorma delicatula TaxID=130591 RepID=UPI003F51A3FD